MKALSLRQPWLHAVLHLGKPLENRRWDTKYRGEVLLHASASVGNRWDFSGSCEAIRDVLVGGNQDNRWLNFRDDHLDITMHDGCALFLPRSTILLGGIIGRARIADVIPPCRPRAAKSDLLNASAAGWRDVFDRPCIHRWHAPEQYGFVLEEVFAFDTPIPWKGALGLFETPFDRNGRRAA